jgi:molybdate transport system substrate-binding protein
MKEAYLETLPTFEKSANFTVRTEWVGSENIKKRLMANEAFDLVMTARSWIDELAAEGKILPNTVVDLAKSGIGVGVKAGAPKPDISTTEAFKRMLLTAKTISYSSGASGLYLIGLIEKLGVSAEVKPKLKQTSSGSPVGAVLAKGEADIGFQQISELLLFPGVDLVGPLPPDIQLTSIFSAALPSGSKERDGAHALIKFLASPVMIPAIKKMGIDPISGP